MKTKSHYYCIIASLFCAILCITSCEKDEDGSNLTRGDGNNSSGFAPSSINNKKIIFNRNGKWDFKSSTNGSSTIVEINAEVTYIAYDRADPKCTYKKSDNNIANYSVSFYHKAYVPYNQSYTYGYNDYNFKLVFTSTKGGTYSGTRSNGTTTENRSGTFLLE